MTFRFVGEYPYEITEVDFKDIDKICELKRDDGSHFLSMNLRGIPSTICVIDGTIEDMIEEIYDHGFEDGMHKEANDHLYQKKIEAEQNESVNYFKNCAKLFMEGVRIGIIGSETKPELKKHIVSGIDELLQEMAKEQEEMK